MLEKAAHSKYTGGSRQNFAVRYWTTMSDLMDTSRGARLNTVCFLADPFPGVLDMS